LRIVEKTDLEMQVTAATASAITGEMHILLVQNGYTI